MNLKDQVRERQMVQLIQKEEDYFMPRDIVSNDDIVTDDLETSKDNMQVYVAPRPLETKSEESKKEKEREEEIFDTCTEIKEKEVHLDFTVFYFKF